MSECAVCGNSQAIKEDSGDWIRMRCTRCGVFRVDHRWLAAARITPILAQDQRVLLSGVVRRDTDELGECSTGITHGSFRSLLARHDKPTNAIAQMERFIAIAANSASAFGAESDLLPMEAMLARLYLPIGDGVPLVSLIRAVADAGYIRPSAGNPYECILTAEGWRLAESLKQTQRTGSQAFVAMWFNTGMDAAFDVGFAPALRSCGYAPYRVDREQHNNKIDDQIVANIRKSRLVVADLTGMRPNVFYEAGLAHGLGIPLILTCNERAEGSSVKVDAAGNEEIHRERWVKMVEDGAFDVRQYLVMRWSTAEDLASKLQARIEALALALKTPE